MKPAQYIASLVPSFARDQVLEDLRITRAEIKEGTLPSYETAAELFKGWKFKSKPLEKMFADFHRITHLKGQTIEAVHGGWKQVLVNLDTLEDLIVKTFNPEIASGGLTYAKAQALQFVEACAFASKFARKFLWYVYVLESAEYAEAGTKVEHAMAPAERHWVEANFPAFCQAFAIVTVGDSKLKHALDTIPEIVVTADNSTTLPHTVGDSRLDPLKMGLVAAWMNPIYHLGMVVAEWQAKRFKAAQEEVRLLQLRKLNLERSAKGQPDARLQREIEYMEGRIQSLNYDIDKMERENG